MVKRHWDPVTDLQLWQINVPLQMQGIQSLIQSLDAQGLFHNPASTKTLDIFVIIQQEILQVHGSNVSVLRQGPALSSVQNDENIHQMLCRL